MNSFRINTAKKTRPIPHCSLLIVICSLLIIFTGCPQTESPGNSQPQAAATPSANPAGTNFDTSIQVTLSCATSGAAIYYTTSGGEPGAANGTRYTGTAITISETTTLKAIAVKEGMNNSQVMSETYTKNTPPETVATPAANPAEATFTGTLDVTLSCETEGAAIYYTINNSEPSEANGTLYTGTPITINETTTIKAIAVKEGMTPSAVMSKTWTASYTITLGYIDNTIEYPEDKRITYPVPLVLPETGKPSITIADYTDFNPHGETYIWGEVEWGDGERFTISGDMFLDEYEKLPAAVRDRIIADGITIYLDTANAAKVDLSLYHIHLLREAFVKQGVATEKIKVDAPQEKFTPLFNAESLGRWRWLYEDDDYVEKTIFHFYPLSDTEVINGIHITADGDPAEKKYKLVYSRPLKVASLLWGESSLYDEYDQHPPFVNGIGLEKDNGGSIILAAGKVPVWMYYGIDLTIDDLLYHYAAAIKEHGLHWDNGVYLDLSQIYIRLPNDATDAQINIAQNGIYDFILAYYNPAKDGTIVGQDLSARLPIWPTGLTFDGLALPAGLTSRNIGGIIASSGDRKAATAGVYGDVGGGYDGQSYQKGEPRVDFRGSITVPMANYMVRRVDHVNGGLGITVFKNTNIIGNGNKWQEGIVNNYLTLIPAIHIGLIGDYGDLTSMGGNLNGEIDITGALPARMAGDKKGSLSVWSDISRETFIDSFRVVHVYGSNSHYIRTGDPYDDTIATELMIFYKKYSGVPEITGATGPHHRAFVDSNDNVKLTGTGSDFTTKYLGSNSNTVVPKFDADSWKAINTIDGDPGNLASNYNALDSQYKWSNQADLDASASVSAAPAQSDVRLAGGLRPLLEAVLTGKLRIKGRGDLA